MYEEDAGNPPVHCDHRPPKVSAIRAGGKVRVQCLTCGTVGPERESPGEAFRALMEVPYRANRGTAGRDCAAGSRRMRGLRGALASRDTAGLRPLL